VFEEREADRLETQVLIEELCEDEAAPWGDWHGRRITPHALARLLRPFGIAPSKWREGGRIVRGYVREAFLDAFSRYLHFEPPHPPQAKGDAGSGDFEEPPHIRHQLPQVEESPHSPTEPPGDGSGADQMGTPRADQRDSSWVDQKDSSPGNPGHTRAVPPSFGAACRPRPIPEEVATEVRRIEGDAIDLGWAPEDLWQTAGWVSELGLAALMNPGDRVEEVTAGYIAIRLRDGSRTRFYRRPARGRGDRGFS